MTHSPLILSLDTVRAWHSGPRLIVEVEPNRQGIARRRRVATDQARVASRRRAMLRPYRLRDRPCARAQLEEGAVEQRPSC
jgi:hypothetical protein